MPYNRKRRGSKKPRKESFETRVLQAVRSKRELKVATINVGRSLNNEIQQADLYNITPNIPQGNQEWQRQGNQINLIKVVIRGYFQKITPSTNPATADANVLIRHQIIKQKNANYNLVGPGGEFANNVLLEGGQAYNGSLFNHLQPLNRNMFSSKKTIRCDLNGSNPTWSADPAIPDSLSGMIKPFSYTLRFGKQGKTLDYQTDGAQMPSNWDYFMINTAQRGLDGNAPDVCQVNYTVHWYYTDA